MSAAVVIHFEYDSENLEQVTVSGHRAGKPLDEQDLQWLAFRALPHLERTAWTTEDARANYHMQHAYTNIVEKLWPEGGPVGKLPPHVAERILR